MVDDEMRNQNGPRRGRPVKSARGRAPFGVNHKLWLKNLPPKDQEYLNAALSGDAATLKRLIDSQEVNLDVVDSYGHTALMNAAWKDRTEAVKLLLQEGVSLDCRNQDGQTAMDKAAYWGFTHILKLLVEAGSTIDIRNNNGETPLHRAAMWGHVDAVKLLLNAKANGNEFKNQRRYTPLHFAAKHGKPEVIRVLLEGKCDPFRRDSCGRTPLELAKRNKKQEVYRLLKEWQRGHEGNTCEEIYSAIMKIEQAGNWAVRQLQISERVCSFNFNSHPAVCDQCSRVSAETLPVDGQADLALTVALVVIADEIPCDEKDYTFNGQKSLPSMMPKFAIERQKLVNIGLKSDSSSESQDLTIQRLASLHVGPVASKLGEGTEQEVKESSEC
jgi:ankyrin repeat protein